MRTLSVSTILIAAAVTAAPAFAQAPATPQQQLSSLLREDASLRARIGRIQLDALVARVDQAIGHKPRADGRIGKPSAFQHDLDLYSF